MDAINIDDLRRTAQSRLPKPVYEYVAGGSYRELTLARNRADLDALTFSGTTMNDVSHIKTATSLAGDAASMPLALAPVGMVGIVWPDGELLAARAAEAAGLPFCLSGFSIASIEDVAAATTRPFWSQLYMMKQRSVNENLIRRADAAGCSALVVTLDVHVHSQRWADNRNGLTSPIRVTAGNVVNILGHLPWLVHMLSSRRWTFATMAQEHPEAKNVLALAAWVNANLDASIDAETIRWVRSLWPRRLILKGILTVDDARRAVDLGADAIVVSNHGGRQLDGAPSTISVLPAIARAVGSEVEVLWDSGVLTGFDIVRAMGRGAHGCLSGRAWTYGLAAHGGKGATRALDLLRQELLDCMALTGTRDITDLAPGLVTTEQPL
ncbi:alpha-hydroxy-acid oxidizing protein [Sphingosinicellaceae bacterium]|nr:alpha-hydroxy-acid oxidizing protein [Sphingosinicellaceae bacterium]